MEGGCEECGDNLESLLHLFWECSKACETWMLFQNFNDFASVQFRCFMDFLWFILMKADWLCEDQAVLQSQFYGHFGQIEMKFNIVV